MRIRSLGEENLVIYIKDQNVFLPNCRKGIELSIVRHESELKKDGICFEDFPIMTHIWTSVNRINVLVNSTGFLTSQGIIVKESRRVMCESQKGAYQVVESGSRAIVRERKGNKMVTSVKKNIKERVQVHSFNNIQKLNLEHFGIVATEPDPVRIIKSLSINNNKYVYTQTEKLDQSLHVMEKMSKAVKWAEDQFAYVEYVVLGAGVLVMVIGVCAIISCISKTKKKKEVNYMQGLILPEDDSQPKRVFKAEVNRKKDEDLDSVTKRMLRQYAENLRNQ